MFPSITFSVAPLVYGVMAAVLVCALVLAVFIAQDARKQQQGELLRHRMQSRRRCALLRSSASAGNKRAAIPR